jgi:hypothetical protein
MSSSKVSLLKRLASILSVGEEDNDYVTDVLDQLIEIGEDVGDVASYLTSFLGGDDADCDDNLMQFANDVRRFKLGEEITIDTVDSSADSDAAGKQPEPEKEKTQHQLQQQRKREEEQRAQQQLQQRLSATTISNGAAQPQKIQSSEMRENPKKGEVVLNNNGGQQSSKQTSKAPSSTKGNRTKQQAASQSKTIATKQQQQPLPPKELKKGKAKTICGCYGNKHKPLTNCLHCGRISCEIEGYDFCPFCHILIEDFSKRIRGDDSSSSALLHKERLLEFDRTAAARTHILDDQEDYFVSSNSMWSTQEEQDNARKKEEERRKMLHERQKQKLSINF